METANFERDDGPPPRLIVTGEIDLEVVEPFRDGMLEIIEAAHSPAHVDLRGVTFFNSTGIGVLIEAQRIAEERDVQLVIDPSSSVMRLLELTGLGEVFTFGRPPDPECVTT